MPWSWRMDSMDRWTGEDMTLLFDRLNKAFDLYNDLAVHLSEASLGSKLATLPSNTIGEQLWCVVGAR